MRYLTTALTSIAALALLSTISPAQVSMGAGGTSSVSMATAPSFTRLASGTSSAPSLAFAANSFDGWYWVSTGNIAYTSQGSPMMKLGTNLSVTLGNTGAYGWANSSNASTGSFNNAMYTGTGSPEGVLTAVAGSLYLNVSGGASTTLYVKESGSGSTGWIAK